MKRQTKNGVIRYNTEKPEAFLGVGLIYLNLRDTVVGTLFIFPTGSRLNFIIFLLPYSLMFNVKVCSYITHPVRQIVYSALHFKFQGLADQFIPTPTRLDFSGKLKPRCNYCAKTIR